MVTTVFYIFLYAFGFLCVLPFSRKVPIWFLSLTAFIWGQLAWLAASLLILFSGLEFTWLNMGLLLSPLGAAAVYLNVKSGTFKNAAAQPYLLLGSLAVISSLAVILSRSSYVFASTDSFNYIFHGKVMARSGLVPWAVDRFTKLGAFSSVMQMSSQILPGDYLSGYQTIMAVILLAALTVSLWQLLQQQLHRGLALVLSAVVVGSLLSKNFLNHSFYIHNNLPAALLLFLAVYSFRNLIQTDAREWQILGVIAAIGFSFTRIEGPLYTCLLLMIMMGIKPFSYRRNLGVVLPYSAFALAWHLYLLFNAYNNQQLSQTNLLLIIAALSGVSLLALASKWVAPWLELLPGLLISLMAASVVLLVLIEPDHMITSISRVWQNLTNIYIWGWTWFLILASTPLLFLKKPDRPEDALLVYFSAGYILTIFLLVITRNPYRLGQTDSANRLMLQILPVMVLAITTQIGSLKDWFWPPATPIE